MLIGHSESITVETHKNIDINQVIKDFEKHDSIKLIDEPSTLSFPTAFLEGHGTDDVYVGDDSFSTKTTYSQTLDNKNMTVTQRQVVFRRGSVVCNVSVTSYGGEPPKVSDLEFIANNQDTLIEQAVRN